MIDSHCHLNASYTKDSVAQIIESFINAGGTKIIDVTTSLPEFQIAQEIAATYPEIVSTTIGIHPESCNETNHLAIIASAEQLFVSENFTRNIVGIGETGLDYSYISESPSKELIVESQEELFRIHLREAVKRNLPVTIHARGTDQNDSSPYVRVIELLLEIAPNHPTYFHSYAGTIEMAKLLADQGNMIGLNGIITYSGAKTLANIAAFIPLENILLETDSPYLIPSNMDRNLLHDKKVNEPQAILHIAKRVAALKKCSVELVLEQTSANATRFFSL